LNQEVRDLESKIKAGAEATTSADLLKALCLLVKVCRDIRTNQTTIMKAQGVKLLEPEERTVEGAVKNPE